MLDWPWQRFEAMFEAHSIRMAENDLRRTFDAVITGLWGNPNFDDTEKEKGVRANALQKATDNYQDAVSMVRGLKPVNSVDQDVDIKEDPFFAAMKLPPEIDDSIEESTKAATELREAGYDQA